MSDPTNSLFTPNSNGGATPPANTPPGNNDALATLLADIKNADGQPKYKDVATALHALKASQEFIPTLQTQLSEAAAKATALEEARRRNAELEALVADLTKTPPQSTPPANDPPKNVDIAATVREVLQAETQARVAKTNTDQVVAKVSEAFGAEAEAKFYAKASELGMSLVEFNALAAKSPQAVLSLFGLTGKPPAAPSSTPTNGTVNSGGFTPPAETLVKSNKKSILLGATTGETIEEVRNAKKMVEELDAQGLSIDYLVNPKNFFKHFN